MQAMSQSLMWLWAETIAEGLTSIMFRYLGLIAVV